MTILIVDDEPGIRLLLEEILTGEGYKIITAKTGKEALEIMKKRKRIQLLMLDYKLPVMDGAVLLKRLQEMNINIPAIVMSGLIETAEKEMEGLPQVRKFLGKPFDVLQVIDDVGEIIKQSK